MDIAYWTYAIWGFVSLAFVTFLPVLFALAKKVKLNPRGDHFADSPHFSDLSKKLLEQHYSRLEGTLVFWKNKAEKHRRFHYYTLCWTIPISILIPIITQAMDSSTESKLFLTIISSHTALLWGFHRALKIENHFKAFRNGESEFYDLYRRLLDRPKSLGNSETEQIENYFSEAERIRKLVRLSEIDNFPMIDDNTKPKIP